MSIRLNKIIREFNVGIGTIVDFLREKGFEVNASPSEKITDEQYEILKKELSELAGRIAVLQEEE